MTISTTPSGITMNDQMMNLARGWFVVYNNGNVVTEDDTDWDKVNRGEIKILGLKWFDKFWTLSGKTAYVQFKRGWSPFNPNGGETPVFCEERCIGYYEGADKVVYRVNEKTGSMKMAVISGE